MFLLFLHLNKDIRYLQSNGILFVKINLVLSSDY